MTRADLDFSQFVSEAGSMFTLRDVYLFFFQFWLISGFSTDDVYAYTTTMPSVSASVMGRSVEVVEKKLCWSDALFYCRDYHWDLLSIRSETEQRAVEEMLKSVSFPVTQHVWLGLRRSLMGDKWFWMSGATENFTNFEGKHYWGDTSPCGAMETGKPYYWRDLPCGEHIHFICLRDIQIDKKRVEFYSSTRP